MTFISSQRVWIDEQFIPATLKLEDGKITEIHNGILENSQFYENARIIPGLIDVHTHGYAGGDASDGDPETLRVWQRYLPQEGVTSFLPGTVTRSVPRIIQALQAIRTVIEEKNEDGAHIPGIFLQGPYTSHEYPGAYDKYLIQKPEIAQFDRFMEASGGHILRVGLAVEKDEGHQVLKHCAELGLEVAVGFSGVSYEEMMQAVEEGASSVVHCFNSMNPLHHRKPGLPGAALSCDALYSEVIADGIHVHPSVINIIGRCKGSDRLVVITDSSRYKGLKPGYYESVDRKVTIGEDGVGRLSDGRLAGSCITMIQSVRNLQTLGKLSEACAINAATINPARMLKLDDHLGLIKTGYQADLTVYDEDYQILQTFVSGIPMLKQEEIR